MSTVVLAVGDSVLHRLCESVLAQGGHPTVALRRPLELLSVRSRVAVDALCVDGSALGLDALVLVRGGITGVLPVVGIGVEGQSVTATVVLPLQTSELSAAVAAAVAHGRSLRAPTVSAPRLRFDPVRRAVGTAERSVILTRTEYRLLEYLRSRAEADVTLEELLHGVWGSSEGIGTAALIRSHVRNLRLKLSQLGAGDVIRVRRGRGYAYVG